MTTRLIAYARKGMFSIAATSGYVIVIMRKNEKVSNHRIEYASEAAPRMARSV